MHPALRDRRRVPDGFALSARNHGAADARERTESRLKLPWSDAVDTLDLFV